MAITPSNVVMGPATLYYAPYGATEPAYAAITSAPNSAIWTDVGAIADNTSVLLEIEHSLTDIGAEQLIDRIGARVTKRVIQVTASLEEATLTNMQLAMNQLLTISQGSGYAVADLTTGVSAPQPTYYALLIDGWAPTTGTDEVDCRRRAIVRKVLSSSKVDLEYEKTKLVLYNTTWSSYWVSSSVSPVEIIDQQS
jgi:hypothetical protein